VSVGASARDAMRTVTPYDEVLARFEAMQVLTIAE